MSTELIKTIYGDMYGFQGDFITKRLKQLGAYERNDLAMVMSFLGEGDTVLDVGGNIGTFAIPVALKVGETGKVYTFEGNQQTYSVLSQNIAINHLENRIQAINAIITSISGNYVLMDISPTHKGGCYFQLAEQPSHQLSDSLELPCTALDDWWKTVNQPQISLIKVDVEGVDLNVLNSAREVIKRDKPVIFVEINAKALSRYGHSVKDVEEFLLGFGYHLFRNIDLKNSGTSDEYTMGRLSHLSEGFLYKDGHYNVLAIYPQSDRYPLSLNYKGSLYTTLYLLFKKFKGFIKGKIQ